MAPFRPANLNRRLVSPTGGNGGVIGTTKTPYCAVGLGTELTLGRRCFGGGSCGGIFKIGESYCGRKQNCNVALVDCGGFYYCLDGTNKRWFVAPCCAEVSRCHFLKDDAITLANSCVGSCGWFIPDFSNLYNGFSCRSYWDAYTSDWHWANDCGNAGGPDAWASTVNFGSGQACGANAFYPTPERPIVGRGNVYRIRAFRCV